MSKSGSQPPLSSGIAGPFKTELSLANRVALTTDFFEAVFGRLGQLSPDQRQTRIKRIKWTIKVLQNLSLERQTVQLVYFLTDWVATDKATAGMRLELLVVSSIYLVLKLQGDLDVSLHSFNDFVTHSLQIGRQLLIRSELLLVALLPADFACLMTFSEFLCSCFPPLKNRLEESYALTTRACELCMGFYLFENRPFDFAGLAAAAFLEAGRQQGFCPGVTAADATDFFSSKLTVGSERIAQYADRFAEENRYVKEIFSQF